MEFSSAASADAARSEFVYIEEDGAVREITLEEAEYLATPFHPADGGRPYIKRGYTARTSNGSLAGFLHRRDVPRSYT